MPVHPPLMTPPLGKNFFCLIPVAVSLSSSSTTVPEGMQVTDTFPVCKGRKLLPPLPAELECRLLLMRKAALSQSLPVHGCVQSNTTVSSPPVTEHVMLCPICVHVTVPGHVPVHAMFMPEPKHSGVVVTDHCVTAFHVPLVVPG